MSNQVLANLRQMRTISSTDNIKKLVIPKPKDNNPGGSPQIQKPPKLPEKIPSTIKKKNSDLSPESEYEKFEFSANKSNSNIDLLKEQVAELD